MKKKIYTREEVRALLKRQIAKSYNTIARMHYTATEEDILRKLRRVKPINF